MSETSSTPEPTETTAPTMQPEANLAKPPEGWAAKKDFFGARFVCLFELSQGEKDKKTAWMVEVLWYSSTAEAIVKGPAKINAKGRAREAMPAPLGVFLFAQAQIFALVNWLRDVMVQAGRGDPRPQLRSAPEPEAAPPAP